MDRDNPAKRNARFAQRAIASLVAGGCAGFVISPGSRHTPLVMAAANAGVPTEVVLDERSAAFLALGWAKAAEAPVALMCTSGTAGANYLPAVVEAWETGVPLVVVTTDRPPEHLGIGAPQTTRQDGFYVHHAKGQCTIGAADDDSALAALGQFEELALLAAAGKPGPVHINVGFREPLWEPSPTALQQQATAPADSRRDAATQTGLDLPEQPRGLLVVGPVQEARPEAAAAVEALVTWAHERGWPVLADVASGLRQNARLAPALLNGYDLFLRSQAVRASLQPDVVVHVGRMPTSKTLFTWLQQLEDRGADVRHLSTDGQPHSLGRAPLVVPIRWQQLLESCQTAEPGAVPDNDWLAGWRRAESLAAAAAGDARSDAGLWEGSVAEIVCAVPADSTLVLGSGMPIRDADAYVPTYATNVRCLVNRGVNGIDGLLATAAGVALHDPDSSVRLVIGDQAFLHDIGSLALVAGRKNLEIIVINNGGSGIFEFLPISQAGAAFEKYFLAPQQADMLTAAAAYGIDATRCATNDALQTVLAAPGDGPRIVEVVVEREHNVYIHKEVGAAVTHALDQAFHLETTDGKGADADRRGVESG